jgi:hypothetical protein
MTLQCFVHVSTPPFVVNVTGPETLNVRNGCEKLSERLGKSVSFSGTESPVALVSNARRSFELFGKPGVSAEELLEQVADWMKCGGETLGKPTHFESRNGKF